MDPGVGAADGGADSYDDDVQQLVPLAAVYPGVLQGFKTVHDGWALPPLHNSPSSFHCIRRFPCSTNSTIYNAIALSSIPTCLPRVRVNTTSAGDYMTLLSGRAA